MANHQPLQEEHPWLSLGKLSHWAWEKIFTRQGTIVFCVGSIAIGMYWCSDPNKPLMILLSPLAIIVFGFFLFLASIVAIFGDSFADWAMGKLFHPPSPKNPLHQLLYFIFSAIGFVLATFVLNIGDPDVRGYWNH